MPNKTKTKSTKKTDRPRYRQAVLESIINLRTGTTLEERAQQRLDRGMKTKGRKL